MYPISISSSTRCRGSPSTCVRLSGNEELDSAAEDATAKADKGEAKQRKCDVRSIEAACRPGVEAISAKLLSKTGNDGVHGRIISSRLSVGTERLSFHPGSDQFSLDFVGGTCGNESVVKGCVARRYNCSAFIISFSIFSILSRSLYFDAVTIATLVRRSDTRLSGVGRRITCCFRRCILCHNDFFRELGSPGNDCTQALLKPVFFF